jgi:Tol biopolymer transport system component
MVMWVFGLIMALTPTAALRAVNNTFVELCPAGGIRARPLDFKPGGIILASFDKTSLWVYNIDTSRRYPLPNTHPCGTNCRLSRDAQWITYVDADTSAYFKMRLDGTQRTPLIGYAADVEWWSDKTLLVWTPGREAYLQDEAGGDRQYLNVQSVMSVQPGGKWGLLLKQAGDVFDRALVDLETRDLPGIAGGYAELGQDTPYFNAHAWSPDGKWLAYAAPGPVDPKTNIAGAELFGIHPGDGAPVQWTHFQGQYGAVRINGRSSMELGWSPDGTRLAFWVVELIGPDPEKNTGNATIHVLNIQSGEIRRYCGFTTTQHTPNPPRLIWSPDGSHLAFGGDVPKDNKPYLLLALDVNTGIMTQLSEGLYPALGGADPVAWGYAP